MPLLQSEFSTHQICYKVIILRLAFLALLAPMHHSLDSRLPPSCCSGHSDGHTDIYFIHLHCVAAIQSERDCPQTQFQRLALIGLNQS